MFPPVKEAKQDRQEIRMDELKAIVDRAQSLGLSETEHATLSAAVETLGFVTSCRWPTKKGPRGQLKRDPLAEFPARG